MTGDVIPLPILPPDPDGDLVGLVVSRLIQEPDAAERLKACAALDGTTGGLSGRLGWVRRLSVRQLHAEGNSYERIGEIMGATRARAYQVSQGRAIDDPHYAWGRVLSTVEFAAYLADRVAEGGRGNRYFGEANSFVTAGLVSASPAMRERAAEIVERYCSGIARSGREERARAIKARLRDLMGEAERAGGLSSDSLTMDQRERVVFGLYHERGERDRLRSAPATETPLDA